jgi:hypothetical protein
MRCLAPEEMSSGWSLSPPADEISSGRATKETDWKTTGGKETREYDEEIDSGKCYNKRKETKQGVIEYLPYQGKVAHHISTKGARTQGFREGW